MPPAFFGLPKRILPSAAPRAEGVSKTRNSFSQMGKEIKGRPQLADGKRIKKIDVRFTQTEYAQVLEMEKTLGISKTELVRLRVLDSSPQLLINAKEMISQLDGIGTELGRSGNNINQLARYANILKKQGILSPGVIERFLVLFGDYVRQQQALETALRKIIRNLGH